MNSQQTVQKIANVAYIVAKVLMIITFVCAGITAGSAILTLTMSASEFVAEILDPTLVEMEAGFNTFQFGILSIASAIICAAEGIVFMYAKRYFKGILDDGTPFTHRGADELKYLGIRLMAFPFGALIIASILSAIFGLGLDMEQSVNIGLGVACILLSFVFHHGADLKEKADKVNDASAFEYNKTDDNDVF